MTTLESAPLITGLKMSREEFIEKWDATPEIKHAELIEGVVYVVSPVSLSHSTLQGRLNFCFLHYVLATPGVQAAG